MAVTTSNYIGTKEAAKLFCAKALKVVPTLALMNVPFIKVGTCILWEKSAVERVIAFSKSMKGD